MGFLKKKVSHGNIGGKSPVQRSRSFFANYVTSIFLKLREPHARTTEREKNASLNFFFFFVYLFACFCYLIVSRVLFIGLLMNYIFLFRENET